MVKIWKDTPVSELSRAQLLDEHHTVHAYFAMRGKSRWKNHPLVVLYSEEFMRERHEQQVREMLRRGYKHHSPIKEG